MSNLRQLENDTIYILREVLSVYERPALLWSMGKDSTLITWLALKAFNGEIPFPVVHIDTLRKFDEMYKFRDRWAREWGLTMIFATNNVDVSPKDKLRCCTELKTNALKKCVERYKFDALILGIRRDEHGIRSKERYYSPRDKNMRWHYRSQPLEVWDTHLKSLKENEHIRVHPILAWRELDIWEFIKQENIPVNKLYFAKGGRRYRSLGCKCCTEPIESKANTLDKIIEEVKHTKIAERSGRAMEKESLHQMEKLRCLGYM